MQHTKGVNHHVVLVAVENSSLLKLLLLHRLLATLSKVVLLLLLNLLIGMHRLLLHVSVWMHRLTLTSVVAHLSVARCLIQIVTHFSFFANDLTQRGISMTRCKKFAAKLLLI